MPDQLHHRVGQHRRRGAHLLQEHSGSRLDEGARVVSWWSPADVGYGIRIAGNSMAANSARDEPPARLTATAAAARASPIS